MASNEAMNEQSGFFGIIDETKSYSYEELWKLCAGPLVDLPIAGSKVYYFPQGHLEHINASTNENLDIVAPLFDLPSKIRCDVMGIQLKVEKDTDEVYAQINLIPDTVQINIPTHDRNRPRPISSSFTKVLTASDTSLHSGLSIPRKHADECLPLLDMTQPNPSQELVVKDLNDCEWRFKHIFRGTPQRHLFTSGWTAFATKKKLVPGDSFVFLRGRDGELRVGIRRAIPQQCNIPSSIMSTECMHHGVIASAMHVIDNHSMFTIMYKPRISQFVVSFDKYVDAMNQKFDIGSRFSMRFESEDFTEKRYSGTIIRIQDFSPHWKDSEWRSLEVQWDKPASIPRPGKVSPWEIEPFAHSSNVLQSDFLKKKRSRQVDETGSTSSNIWIPTLTQGQEIGQSSKGIQMGVPKLNYRDVVDESNISSGWLMRNYPDLTIPKPNENEQMVPPIKERITIDAATNFKLFGVDFAVTPTETKDPPRLIDSNQKSEISKLSEEKKFGHNHIMTSPKEVQSKQANSIRSRTKVQMQGVTIGRAVDLTLFDGYNPLIDELEKIFDLRGELQTRSQWEIVFTDNEGDQMLMGDDPWPEFCNMVKKILICSKEYVKKMKARNKLSEGESTILACPDIPQNIKKLNNNLHN